MKYLLLSLLFIFSANAEIKGTFVNKSNVKNPTRRHRTMSLCESEEGTGNCINTGTKDMRRFMLGQEDNLDSPIFRLPNNSPVKLSCFTSADCPGIALGVFDGESFPDRVCLGEAGSTERWDELVNHPGMTGVTGPWFIWCEKETGNFNQRDIIIIDPAGIIAADAEDAQVVSDKSARDTAKSSRDIELDNCVQSSKNPTLTPQEIVGCIAAMVREIRGNKVAIPDL